jgi:hypothetical protein
VHNIDQVLHLPFTPSEEQHVISYLCKSGSSANQELLVVYFLQCGRFVEAVQQNAKLNHSVSAFAVVCTNLLFAFIPGGSGQSLP